MKRLMDQINTHCGKLRTLAEEKDTVERERWWRKSKIQQRGAGTEKSIKYPRRRMTLEKEEHIVKSQGDRTKFKTLRKEEEIIRTDTFEE